MKIYQIINLTIYTYNVVAETEKSYVVTLADSDGEYEHICRKTDENIKWFSSTESAEKVKAMKIELQTKINQLQKEFA